MFEIDFSNFVKAASDSSACWLISGSSSADNAVDYTNIKNGRNTVQKFLTNAIKNTYFDS